MNPRPFDFYRTGFYMMWSTLTQWRWVKIGLFAVFLLWTEDRTNVDPVAFQPLAIAVTGILALASLLDTVSLLLPAKVMAKLTRTREEKEAWEALGAMEAKP